MSEEGEEKERSQHTVPPKVVHLQDHSSNNKDKDGSVNVNLGIGGGGGSKIQVDSEAEAGESPLPLTVASRLLHVLGDMTSPYKFAQWLEAVRKRSAQYRASGFPHRSISSIPHHAFDPPSCAGESIPFSTSTSATASSCASPKLSPDISLWERLGKATALNIEDTSFSWDMLSSLHHTEHSTSTDNSEDELSKPLEVTVNSGGVVFFALFNVPGVADSFSKEAAAVIKIPSSRMAAQSERLGYEFAKWLGVRTPQVRVIHNCCPEWLQIKVAAEKARDTSVLEGDEIGEMTCTELLEALELSRCLLLMSYVHGSPLLDGTAAFESVELAEKTAAEKTASALGRILMLDLVIRNEDRLPCRQLRWRGNSANLLLSERMVPARTDALEEAFDSAIKRYKPRMIRALEKERASSVDSRLSSQNEELMSQGSDLSDISLSPSSVNMGLKSEETEMTSHDFYIVAIDSGVPRRPPMGKRSNDQTTYPKLVELLLNSSKYSSNLLHEITGGKLGLSLYEDKETVHALDARVTGSSSIAHAFRSGFRAALRDLQGIHIFLLTLHQKLDCLLRSFVNIINRTSLESDRDDPVVPESPSQVFGGLSFPSPHGNEGAPNDTTTEFMDVELQKSSPKLPSSGNKEWSDSSSPLSRENWHGKFQKGGGDSFRNMRLTIKLRDFHKSTKVDAELGRELEQWTEMLKSDAIRLCQENNFNTGFFEANDNTGVIDAYELKVRLEHILERIALISDAANTERPSAITSCLFIGGAIAAKSVFTLQHLAITHILCLCSNEIGQSDSQFPDLFQYKNFSVTDNEDTNIGSIFEEACDFIDHVEQSGGKVLVHCFEGRSRSATLVIAYLMLRKNYTLLEAWNALKRVHRRAQPNDGFARVLLDLDRKLHGKVSMEWQQRKPSMKVCVICGKNAGLSSTSLKLHMQKAHRRLSSGSVDSAITMEIQKALTALKISRSASVSPTQRQSHDIIDE